MDDRLVSVKAQTSNKVIRSNLSGFFYETRVNKVKSRVSSESGPECTFCHTAVLTLEFLSEFRMNYSLNGGVREWCVALAFVIHIKQRIGHFRQVISVLHQFDFPMFHRLSDDKVLLEAEEYWSRVTWQILLA